LRLIFRMVDRACRSRFCLYTCSIPHFWMFASTRRLDYLNAIPEIFDAPLTLILRMGQGACHYCFCLSRQPIPYLWMGATNCHWVYPRCKARNHWHSVDAHTQTGALTVLLAILPIKAANTLVMHSSNQIIFDIRDLQDHKRLILCWRSFRHGHIRNMQPFTSA